MKECVLIFLGLVMNKMQF